MSGSVTPPGMTPANIYGNPYMPNAAPASPLQQIAMNNPNTSPALAAIMSGFNGAQGNPQSQPQAPQQPQQPSPAQVAMARPPASAMGPQSPPQAPQQASPAQPPAQPQGQPQAAPQAPPSPFQTMAPNIAKFESGGGALPGNGGGMFQFEPQEQQAFVKSNPQYATVDPKSPQFQQAAYNWLTTSNASNLTTSGVNPTAPGVTYAAFALGAPAAAALAKADPTATAASIVGNLKDGSTIIKGNPELFANGATADDVFNRAAAIETTGSLPNAAASSSSSGSAPAASQSGVLPSSGSSDDDGSLAKILSALPNAPKLQAAQGNPWLAFASGMLSGHSFGDGLGKGLGAANQQLQTNMQSKTDTAQSQYGDALNAAQAKIELGKMSAFSPLMGTQTVMPDGTTAMQWRNGFGQTELRGMDGTPIKMAMQQTQINAENGRLNTRLLNADALARYNATNRANLATSGVNGSGSRNAPVVGPAPQPPPLPTGGNPPPAPAPAPAPAPSPAPAPALNPLVQAAQAKLAAQGTPAPAAQPQAPAPGQPAPAQAASDPYAAAAAPYVTALSQQAQGQNLTPTIANAAMKTNQAEYDEAVDAASKAVDAKVATTKALQAVAQTPGAFSQSSAWSDFNNRISSTFGFSPFSGVSNAGLTLSQAFIKQANSGGIGELLHDAMGISRPSQMEVQMVQHAVANGSMPLSTLQYLMQSSINNNDSAIAEGNIVQKVWQTGKFQAVPGAFAGLRMNVQNDLESGRMPSIFKPMVNITPGSPSPSGGPAPAQPQQSPQAPAVPAPPPTVSSQQQYDALPKGAQYIAPDGRILTKTQ